MEKNLSKMSIQFNACLTTINQKLNSKFPDELSLLSCLIFFSPFHASDMPDHGICNSQSVTRLGLFLFCLFF